MADDLKSLRDSRYTAEYIVHQLNGTVDQETHQAHKTRIRRYDELYRGDLRRLFPNETALPDEPMVENKLKNATHDLARLASEARGMTVFMPEGTSDKADTQAMVRAQIADTIWQVSGARDLERKLYMDSIAAGYMALAVYSNSDSPYAQVMRLNPRFTYPTVWNNQLVDMLYVENLPILQAASLFPDLGLTPTKGRKDETVEVVQYFTKDAIVKAVVQRNGRGQRANAVVTDTWKHRLDCVPVAFVQVDSADDHFRGLLDQLGGPLMARNKSARLMVDYLEAMAHAPVEAKNVLNADHEPGPFTVYQHDPNAQESFIRRVQPASPSGALFGLMDFLGDQESKEAVQPPSRVGVVSQSIASGSFVQSTQGTLSSTVKEMQSNMVKLRVQAQEIALKLERKHLAKEKPLIRPVGNKRTYNPAKDLTDWCYHTVQFGATAGMERQDGDVRILQFKGAGLISDQTARRQIDFLDDESAEQEQIDLEQVRLVRTQRFAADTSIPFSSVVQVELEMSKGKSLIDALEAVLPQLVQAEQAAAEPAAAPGGAGPSPEPVDPAQEQASLEAGGQLAPADLELFAPPPLNQNIIRNPV